MQPVSIISIFVVVDFLTNSKLNCYCTLALISPLCAKCLRSSAYHVQNLSIYIYPHNDFMTSTRVYVYISKNCLLIFKLVKNVELLKYYLYGKTTLERVNCISLTHLRHLVRGFWEFIAHLLNDVVSPNALFKSILYTSLTINVSQEVGF